MLDQQQILIEEELQRRRDERETAARQELVSRMLVSGIRTDDELRRFVFLAFGVEIPDKQICPNHSTPFRAFADAFFARSPVSVWKASRGLGGKSYLLALLGLTEAIALKADVNILGGSGKQSANVLEHMSSFWYSKGAPRDKMVGNVSREMRFVDGNSVEALLASQTSVRGPHPQRLRLDEIDEMDLRILDSAMGQPMGKRGIASQVVQSSTHQYPSGTMTECLKRAAENGYPVYEWCYKETRQPHGWLSDYEVERKRSQMTAVTWGNEVELQEPSPETRAIVTAAVDATFLRQLGYYEGTLRQYIEIEAPTEEARYSHGADWARDVDYTVIVTFRIDCNPMRLVAFERRGREPYPVMVGRFDERVRRYGGRRAHDATGLGTVVSDYILQSAENITLVGRARQDLFSEYIAGIERGELEAPFINYMYTEHKLADVEAIYGPGHPPDSFVAGAMAYHAAGRRRNVPLRRAMQQSARSKWSLDDSRKTSRWRRS